MLAASSLQIVLTLGRGLERRPLLITNITLGSGWEGVWFDQGSDVIIAIVTFVQEDKQDSMHRGAMHVPGFIMRTRFLSSTGQENPALSIL